MIAAALALGLSALGNSWAAGAALDAEELKVYSPPVSYGERAVEWNGFTTRDGQRGCALSAEYGLTPYWMGEVYEVFHGDPGQAVSARSIEIENRFQLAPQGEYGMDPGLVAEAELPQQSGNPTEFHLTPILEKQIGRVLLTLNLPFEWQSGPGFTPGTGLLYAAKAERLISRSFSPALEAFGEPGTIGRFGPAAQETHMIGPAVYGFLRLGGRRNLEYSVSYLYGLDSASPAGTLVTRLELEF